MKRALVLALGILALATTLASAQTAPGTGQGPSFVENDGDGICDLYQSRPANGRAGQGQKKGYGPGDGTGLQGQGPRDGSG